MEPSEPIQHYNVKPLWANHDQYKFVMETYTNQQILMEYAQNTLRNGNHLVMVLMVNGWWFLMVL